MSLRFSKMHGLGNDFLMLDCRARPFALEVAQIRAMADRHIGIGFDQLISIESPHDADIAGRYGIWNADGSPAGQCGNGVRCVAAWLHRAGAVALDQPLRLQSPSGPVQVRLLAANSVTVAMGEPDFAPARVPFAADRQALEYPIVLTDGETLNVGAVSVGNPHAVMVVPRLDDPALERWGPALSAHPRFPDRCNAGFVQRRDRQRLALRVHERGAGWTRACGTGACAAMAVLRARGEVDERVAVSLPGGTLQIDWAGPGHALWMTGPAAFAFEGQWSA